MGRGSASRSDLMRGKFEGAKLLEDAPTFYPLCDTNHQRCKS